MIFEPRLPPEMAVRVQPLPAFDPVGLLETLSSLPAAYSSPSCAESAPTGAVRLSCRPAQMPCREDHLHHLEQRKMESVRNAMYSRPAHPTTMSAEQDGVASSRRRDESAEVRERNSGSPSGQIQDCIFCRITGTVVFSSVSLGAFKEAWKLAYSHEAPQPLPKLLPTPDSALSAAQNWRQALVSLVHAMEVFPSSTTGFSTTYLGEPNGRASKAYSALASPQSNVQPPRHQIPSSLRRPLRAKIAFLLATGTFFAGGAVYRAVMPATQPLLDQTSFPGHTHREAVEK